MKKILIIPLFLGITFLVSGCGNTQPEDELKQLTSLTDEKEGLATPSRPAEINGIVSLMDGNKLILKNEVGREILSEEEQVEKSAERQSMTQEERQALRTEEKEAVETEDLTLVIPVGTLVLKGLGDGGGGLQKTEFSELKKGAYISIWRNGDNIEVIKIKGL